MTLTIEQAVNVARPFDERAGDFTPISLKDFQAMLAVARGPRFVTIVSRTIPTMRKKGNPYRDNCVKIARRNAAINCSYESLMNNAIVRLIKDEADNETIVAAIRSQYGLPVEDPLVAGKYFTAGPRQWGTRLYGLPFVSHVTKSGEHRLYLETFVMRELAHQYQTLDGDIIPDQELKDFIDLEPAKLVELKDYDTRNLVACVCGGQGYLITSEVTK